MGLIKIESGDIEQEETNMYVAYFDLLTDIFKENDISPDALLTILFNYLAKVITGMQLDKGFAIDLFREMLNTDRPIHVRLTEIRPEDVH